VMFMRSVQPWSPTIIDMPPLLQFCRGKLSKYQLISPLFEFNISNQKE
jgi:hypothetical protein